MIPLAERVRPKNIGDFIGQKHLVGDNAVIKKSIDAGSIPSVIFWGPPGVGKTTLASLIASHLQKPFFSLSAISAGVKEVREVIQKALYSKGTILFIDEIHRFNKSQQDALLGAIEKGIITLIGATTENPSFEVNSAILSRCQVYTLYSLSKEELIALVDSAIEKDEFLQKKEIKIESYEALLKFSDGDARKILNLLELVVAQGNEKEVVIADDLVQKVAQKKAALYDKSGEQHYDIISAFIKSLRGSDPNAAIYWLARMLEGGEEPKFIARRMLILASEDIGNANPTALVIATNCFHAVNFIGYPEAEIILSHTAAYLASSPKSNATYMALLKAKELVKKTGNLKVPMHLRNSPTKLMKQLGYGKGYIYPHDAVGSFSDQEYLPDEIKGSKLYEPSENQRENEIKSRLKRLWPKYDY